jgi:hypothetical protein
MTMTPTFAQEEALLPARLLTPDQPAPAKGSGR